MKAWHVLQGSDEWRRLRLGIPTSSCFDKIVTPTGRMSIAKDGKGFSQNFVHHSRLACIRLSNYGYNGERVLHGREFIMVYIK